MATLRGRGHCALWCGSPPRFLLSNLLCPYPAADQAGRTAPHAVPYLVGPSGSAAREGNKREERGGVRRRASQAINLLFAFPNPVLFSSSPRAPRPCYIAFPFFGFYARRKGRAASAIRSSGTRRPIGASTASPGELVSHCAASELAENQMGACFEKRAAYQRGGLHPPVGPTDPGRPGPPTRSARQQAGPQVGRRRLAARRGPGRAKGLNGCGRPRPAPPPHLHGNAPEAGS